LNGFVDASSNGDVSPEGVSAHNGLSFHRF
jgi:hypothetical protein